MILELQKRNLFPSSTEAGIALAPTPRYTEPIAAYFLYENT